jgi:superoxide dismutase, Cu-Zn family
MRGILYVAALLLVSGASHAETAAATAQMRDRDGKPVGEVRLAQMARGVVIRVEMQGLPPGWHAMHIHAVGKCEPPFATAGGHFNPTNRKHGFETEGSHAGDLPNIFADGKGVAKSEMTVDRVSLVNDPDKPEGFLFGPSGTAIVVHASRDDYKTDPAGNSGDRIACGVIAR